MQFYSAFTVNYDKTQTDFLGSVYIGILLERGGAAANPGVQTDNKLTVHAAVILLFT